MKKACTIGWLVTVAVLSIASTVAILNSQPPRFEQVFHKVADLPGSPPPLEEALWQDNDTLLFPPSLLSSAALNLSLSHEALTTDDQFGRTIGETADVVRESPDGKWLVATYVYPWGNASPGTVRIFSMVDHRQVAVDKSSTTPVRLLTWLPDNRHWAEIGPKWMVVHDRLHPGAVSRKPVKIALNSAMGDWNSDGTSSPGDIDLNLSYANDYATEVAPDGHLLVDGTSINLMANPVTGTHAVNMPPHTFSARSGETFFSTTNAEQVYCYLALCPGRKLVAYEMYTGFRLRKKWIPSWVPLSTKASLSYWICDFSGHHAHILAVQDVESRYPIPKQMSWSPDGRKLILQDGNGIWEANVD